MIIERIRFGTASIYRPSAISKLVREEKHTLTEEAVTLEGEKRQAKDNDQDSAHDSEAQPQDNPETPSPAANKRAEGVPLDVVA